MKVKYTKQIEQSYYTCDLCGKRVVQDGVDICLIYGREEIDGVYGEPDEPQYHFHETCLQEHIEENILKK